MNSIKKVLFGVLCATLLISTDVTAFAKSNLSVLKNGYGWEKLSEQDREDTITALVDVVSKDLGIVSTPRLYFYSADDWPAAAEYYDCINYIYVNMDTFKDNTDSDAAGESIGYHIVKMIAHEVRHDYQFEHMFDDSDYGRAVKANKDNYQSYSNDLEAYRNQFIEVDAESYGIDFANKYVKNKTNKK